MLCPGRLLNTGSMTSTATGSTQSGPRPARPDAPHVPIGVRHDSIAVWLRLAAPLMATALYAADAAPCAASAYFLREQSAAAMGNAFAGAAAGADDATYMFFNGAALGHLEGNAIGGVSTAIRSSARLKQGTASTLTGAPIEGNEGGDAGGAWLVPALYGLWDVSRSFGWHDPVRLGIAVNAPFGYETEYRDGWVGRYYALQSRLRTLAVNPVLAWSPWDGVSLAAGAQLQRIDAKLTNAIDFGSLGAAAGVPGAVPGGQDGFGKLTGDDWGFGWTLGLLVEPRPGTRIGVSWRSAVRHELSGDARLRLDNAGIGAALGQSGGTTGASAKLTTPDVVSFGIHHRLDETWTLVADATWTRWSSSRVLRVRFDDGRPPDVTEQDWRDTWFFAGGASVRLDEQWTLRCGIGWDQSPSRTRTRSPRTPANSGLMIAAGGSWQIAPALGVSFAYSHFFIESARIDLQDSAAGNASRGDLSGSSGNGVDALSLQLIWSF